MSGSEGKLTPAFVAIGLLLVALYHLAVLPILAVAGALQDGSPRAATIVFGVVTVAEILTLCFLTRLIRAAKISRPPRPGNHN